MSELTTNNKETAIVKAGEIVKNINDKIEIYSELKIEGLEDKEGYKKVDSARKELKSLRVEVEKTFKAERDVLNIAVKKNLQSEKEVLAVLIPVETKLKSLTDFVDNEKQRIKEEEEAKERAVIASRFDRINKMNLSFDGSNYIFGELKISVIDIQTSSEEVFNEKLEELISARETFLKAQEEEAEKKKKEQEEIERQQKEEAEKLAKIKEEQEAKEKKLRAERKELRTKELALMGIGPNSNGSIFLRLDANISIGLISIETFSEEEWDNFISQAETCIEEAEEKAKAAEEKRKSEIEAARIEGERKAKEEAERKEQERKEAEEKAKKDAEEKAASDAKAKAEKEESERKEAERKEMLRPDKDKLIEWGKSIWINANVPLTLENPEARKITDLAREKFEEIGKFIIESANKL